MLDPASLRHHPLLADASAAALSLLAAQALPMQWRARQALFRRGDPPIGLILVLSGRVRVVREELGRRWVLHVEERGGTLGEVPLFDGSPMPATAIAAEPTTGILIIPELVRAAMRADAGLADQLLQRLARRVRTLADRIERLTRHSVSRRLAAVLLERAAQTPGAPLTLGMSQEQFAEELGTVREVLVRELGGLVRAGVLAPLGRGRFEVRDIEALKRTAAG
jgi:CRP-like cAMP-binding protein